MPRYKTKLDKFQWYDIDATTSPDGPRIYHTPAGDAPSVTTILGSLPNPELDEWRERVGEEEANRISKEATDIGTLMHDSLECHLLDQEYVPNPDCNPDLYLKTAEKMANVIKRMGWKNLNEVWAVEIPLHFENLYAGRTDLVGMFEKQPHILDYKTSKYIKPSSHLKKYRLQLAAYALAMQYMFEMRFDHAVNFFAIRPNEEFKIAAKSHIESMDPVMMQDYKYQWIDILIDFHSDYDPSRLEHIDALIDLVDAK